MASVVLPGLAEQLDANNLISSSPSMRPHFVGLAASNWKLAMRDALTSLRRDVIHSVVSLSSGTHVQVSDSLASPLRSHLQLPFPPSAFQLSVICKISTLAFLPHTSLLCLIRSYLAQRLPSLFSPWQILPSPYHHVSTGFQRTRQFTTATRLWLWRLWPPAAASAAWSTELWPWTESAAESIWLWPTTSTGTVRTAPATASKCSTPRVLYRPNFNHTGRTWRSTNSSATIRSIAKRAKPVWGSYLTWRSARICLGAGANPISGHPIRNRRTIRGPTASLYSRTWRSSCVCSDRERLCYVITIRR